MTRAIITTLVVLSTVTAAQAAPLYFSGTGHYYELVTPEPRLNWHEARAEAASRRHLGLHGHLVTLTSGEENDFVTDTLMGTEVVNAWGGGYQPDGSGEPDADWNWVTGEAWTYTHWRSGEPNNNGNEDALMIYSLASWADGHWNDHDKLMTPSEGYVVEYEVPEPATLGMLALGGLALLKRKK